MAKKSPMENTPKELTPERPGYYRSKSSQSVLRVKQDSMAIPEHDPVSHSTRPSLPTFHSSSQLSTLSAEHDVMMSPPIVGRRKRLNSIERDADMTLNKGSRNDISALAAEAVPESDTESSTSSGDASEQPKQSEATAAVPEIFVNDDNGAADAEPAAGVRKRKKKAVLFYSSSELSNSLDSDSKRNDKANYVEEKTEKTEQDTEKDTGTEQEPESEHRFFERFFHRRRPRDEEATLGMYSDKPWFPRHGDADDDNESNSSPDSDNDDLSKEQANKADQKRKKQRNSFFLRPKLQRSSSSAEFFYSKAPKKFVSDDLQRDLDVPAPDKLQDGFLSSFFKLYNMEHEEDEKEKAEELEKEKFPKVVGHLRSASVENLLGHRNSLKSNQDSKRNSFSVLPPKTQSTSNVALPSFHQTKPKRHRKHKHKLEAQITVHVTSHLQRQQFILKICSALMQYGAPPHRLEEYMVKISRVLQIDSSFLYFPGCMIVAFNDPATKTTEMQLVRTSEGLNLSKLHDAHALYKFVIHDIMGSDEAEQKLDKLTNSPQLYPKWANVLFYGLGSAVVCPFAFSGSWVDMPICFLIGICVGILQFYIAPRRAIYSHVFEVSASVVVSFIARALGSIHDGRIFCFSAIAQGSLALILPGFIILTGALELSSRNIVNGSVRMFYAIIYSFFLSFGITIGAALYGWIDHNAVDASTCSRSSPSPWFRFLFVPLFSVCLALINQANWKQLPAQVTIASAGYVISYFSSLHFSSSSEFTAALAAVVIGVLGNLYSRVAKGLAISAMLPAIFVQVPSGIAGQSSLLAGVASANQIVSSLANSTSSSTSSSSDSSTSLSFGFSMIQVAIGITVGLFTASMVVYPFGKQKTALFTL